MYLSGIFPDQKSTVLQFSERILQDVKMMDVIGSWLSDDVWLRKRYFSNTVSVPIRYLELFRYQNPWSQALKGKKVLVIHPFDESIRSQYEKNRDKLFNDKKVLPKFELKTLKSVQSIANNPVGFSSWFEALDYMCGQVSSIDFDIAIIGAGGYGLPLASFIKRIGKKSIHMGGATQMLFGIRGKKWEDNPKYQKMFNEYWVSPLPSEVPPNHKKVEGGCYW